MEYKDFNEDTKNLIIRKFQALIKLKDTLEKIKEKKEEQKMVVDFEKNII